MAFKSDYAYDLKGQGIQSILKGLYYEKSWKFGTFDFILQNRLFGKTENNVFTAIDLLATNIQRGRDHGLQPYIKYVELCHGIIVKNFTDLNGLVSKGSISILQSLYE